MSFALLFQMIAEKLHHLGVGQLVVKPEVMRGVRVDEDAVLHASRLDVLASDSKAAGRSFSPLINGINSATIIFST